MANNEQQREHADRAQKIIFGRRALETGRIKIPPDQEQFARELLAAPIGPLGLVDVRNLSQETIRFASMLGLAARAMQHFEPEEERKPPVLSAQEIQLELFSHFTHFFVALVGVAPEENLTRQDIKEHMLALLSKKNEPLWRTQVEAVEEELRAFYEKYRSEIYRQAKALGGVKLVTGGQRAFEHSALQGIRISSLYADTQLIPDPIYPHLVGDLHLNAQPLQLAFSLYFLLKLRPLVDAQLPVPPIFVFPSFEKDLEKNDPVTMTGINDLIVRVVGAACDGTFTRVEELAEFSVKHEARFVEAIDRARLYVPPGADPNRYMPARDAAALYLEELEGVRDASALAALKKAPVGLRLLNGIGERLIPQYHLLDNSTDLVAQPLLTQPVHWYYFERCANVTSTALVQKSVLSEQAFTSLRALHDDSLTWLANVPVEGLAELHRNLEHQAFRDELKKLTTQLASAGVVDLNDAVREVRTGLDFLFSKQKKALRDIEDRYAPKKWGVFAGGALGVITAASAALMPSLAPLLGASIPAAAAVGAALGTAVGAAKEKAGELNEKSRASRTMLGMLATARGEK